jgi:hypothetical protein
LAQGNAFERKAAELFDYDTVEFMKGRFKEYDFVLTKNEQRVHVEVKSDNLTQRTGNLCIEFECNKKPSGITATTADYWVYYVVNKNAEDDAYLFPIADLREMAPKYRAISGGDGYRARMYLMPRTKAIKYLVSPGEAKIIIASGAEKGVGKLRCALSSHIMKSFTLL